METKRKIRKQMITKRLELSTEACETFSHNICNRLFEQPWYSETNNICVYMAIKQEANLMEFIHRAWKDEKSIYAPRVYKQNISGLYENVMDFYKISSLSDLEQGSFGVMEPIRDAIKYIPKETTIMLVPGVAFSINGNRIGYGKGYYDRYIQTYRDMLHPIGITYEMQIVEAFQAEEQDIPMTELITEKRKVMIYDESE